MKTTQIVLLFLASLLTLAGCNKKGGGVSNDMTMDTTAIVKEIFCKLPNESSPGEFSPDKRRKLLNMPGDQQLASDNGEKVNGMVNAFSDGSKGLSTLEWFGMGDGFHSSWDMGCYFVEDGSEVLVLVANTYTDAPTFATFYMRAFRYEIATGELTSIQLPFEAFTEKELIDDSKISTSEMRKFIHQFFKKGEGENLIYSIRQDGISCSFSSNEDDKELGYLFEGNAPFPTVRRVWNGKEFVKEDAQEGFAMTITGYEFSSTVTAQNLRIDWGDGTIETLEACDNRSIQHTYKESEPHIVTAKAENLTKLEISGGPLSNEGPKITSLDVSRCTHLIHLDCSSNQLKSLDVSKNYNLTTLWCNSNQLTGLNLSKNPELSELNCRTNQLTNLDVSWNPKLKTVDCGNNELSAKVINAIFNDLPVNLCGRIDFTRNEGNDQTCDAFLAEKKGWRVIFYENYGAVEVELIEHEKELDFSSDFQAFIKNFFADEDYQLSHIQLPLPTNTSKVDLTQEDWCFRSWWGHILVGTVEVGNTTYRSTFEEYYGVRYIYNVYNGDNLIYVFTFEKINEKWMMIEFSLGAD